MAQNNYVVINAKYKNMHNIPILLDAKDSIYIKSLNKTWKCANNGTVYMSYESGDKSQDIYMHEIIMALKLKDNNSKRKSCSIIHINRIGLDNRRINLIYDTNNKEINKNLRKKKRIIVLPESSNMLSSELPTYVWYLKPNDSHGERFIVNIGDIKWKTSSSKHLSLRYKFEESKKYLRNLKIIKPHIFDDYCMNGEFTKQGKQYADDFFSIIDSHGYNYNNSTICDDVTREYLEENLDGLSDDEIIMLHLKIF
jgi:hypothetical protein